MSDFGGIMHFTLGGTPYTIRGKVKTSPSNVKADKIANTNGSVSRSFAVTGYGAEVTFEDSPTGTATALDWDAILKGGPYNASLVEDQIHVMHTWTNMIFTGTPSVDRETGEVTGLEIHSPNYNKVAV